MKYYISRFFNILRKPRKEWQKVLNSSESYKEPLIFILLIISIEILSLFLNFVYVHGNENGIKFTFRIIKIIFLDISFIGLLSLVILGLCKLFKKDERFLNALQIVSYTFSFKAILMIYASFPLEPSIFVTLVIYLTYFYMSLIFGWGIKTLIKIDSKISRIIIGFVVLFPSLFLLGSVLMGIIDYLLLNSLYLFF